MNKELIGKAQDIVNTNTGLRLAKEEYQKAIKENTPQDDE